MVERVRGQDSPGPPPADHIEPSHPPDLLERDRQATAMLAARCHQYSPGQVMTKASTHGIALIRGIPEAAHSAQGIGSSAPRKSPPVTGNEAEPTMSE